MPQKADRTLIALLLALSFLPLALPGEDRSPPAYAEVSIDGSLLRRIPLTGRKEKEEIPIRTPWGENILTVEEGGIAVTEADCPDRLCVRMGRRHHPGDTIACLPHRLLIEIRGEVDEDGILPAK